MQSYAVSEVISDDERERLILQHLPQVRLIARRIQERLPEDISLEDLITTGEQGKDLLHYLPDADDNLPSKVLEKSELQRLLAEGIDGIPKMERTVLGLYYQEELTLREIAQVVNLHESRISQLKSQAILRLRSHMAKQWPVSRGVVTV